ncbi:MAG TPA: ATP-binding cassette domain-containing protein [Paenalcaligenes sp.]|nr:ATP-binding cassette domain-containing protein [Paenalcaligenes sp.]
MIEIKNVSKQYDHQGRVIEALKGVSLSVKAGEVFGIIGRSGAGKSTLIRLINQLERPTTGEVWLDGECLTQMSEGQLRRRRQKIGMVFQHFNLLHARTVRDNVRFPLRLAGLGRRAQNERAAQMLEWVGLSQQIDQYPRQLSGGQQQRVGIARALANEPKILLCDEATSALDPETTQSILRLLLQVNKELGITIVLITHSMDVIRQICDRVAVIEQGEIVESGAVVDVFLRPQHEVTQSLLSESGMDTDGWKQLAAQVSGKILRLSYSGERTTQPVLTKLSRDLDLDISILHGAVGQLKQTPYGQIVIEVQGARVSLAEIEQQLAQQGIDVEVLRA